MRAPGLDCTPAFQASALDGNENKSAVIGAPPRNRFSRQAPSAAERRGVRARAHVALESANDGALLDAPFQLPHTPAAVSEPS